MSFKWLTCKAIGHKYPSADEVSKNGWQCNCQRCGKKDLVNFVRMTTVTDPAKQPPPAYTRSAQSFTRGGA